MISVLFEKDHVPVTIWEWKHTLACVQNNVIENQGQRVEECNFFLSQKQGNASPKHGTCSTGKSSDNLWRFWQWFPKGQWKSKNYLYNLDKHSVGHYKFHSLAWIHWIPSYIEHVSPVIFSVVLQLDSLRVYALFTRMN